METQGVNGQWYICTLIDEYSRFTMLRTISSKAEASAALIDMISAIETQTGHQAKTIKADNGGEYRSTELLQYLRTKGISLKETFPYHSQTNAVAERTNRTLVTMARIALLHAKLPKNLWPEAVAHAAYTKNRTSHQTLSGKSPVELLLPQNDVRQQRSKFCAFGERIWTQLPHTVGKLTARSTEAPIVGYAASSGIYRVYSKERRVTTTKEPRYRSADTYPTATSPTLCMPVGIEESQESQGETKINVGSGVEAESEATNEAEEVVPNTPAPVARPRRSTRERIMPERYRRDGDRAYVVSTTSPSVTAALAGPDGAASVAAIEQEKGRLKKYGVYEELDRLPPGKQTVNTKWVHRGKFDHVRNLGKRRKATHLLSFDHDGTRKLTPILIYSNRQRGHGQVHAGAEQQEVTSKRFP
jgi:hypothetical protein